MNILEVQLLNFLKSRYRKTASASENVYSKQIAEQERNISRLVEK